MGFVHALEIKKANNHTPKTQIAFTLSHKTLPLLVPSFNHILLITYSFTGCFFLIFVPKNSTKIGIGIIPTVMNPSNEQPQPSPSAPNRDGPASGRNAAAILRRTVKAASPEAEYRG